MRDHLVGFGVSNFMGYVWQKAMARAATVAVLVLGTAASALGGEFNQPWRSANSAIVLDAYEYTQLDWTKLPNNKRLAAFINKASDGLAPKYRCGGDKHCRLKWRRYSATKELYITRKVLAKTQGLKWGAYHLARPGNPIKQAQHFLQFTKPDKDDLLALDIEHNDPAKWMSLKDAEIFARYVKARVGRYPVLYTNHATSKFIADNRAKYPLLSRLNLWYARYKPSIPNVFPMGNWPSYTIWQFSSMANCNKKSCLRRINGADDWIDVNVVALSPAELRKQWPFAELRSIDVPAPSAPVVMAKGVAAGVDTMTTASVAAVSYAPMPRFSLPVEVQKGGKDVAVVAPNFRPGTQFALAVSKKPKTGRSDAKQAWDIPVQLASLSFAPSVAPLRASTITKRAILRKKVDRVAAVKSIPQKDAQGVLVSGPDTAMDELTMRRVLARFTLPDRLTTPKTAIAEPFVRVAQQAGLPGDL